MQFDKSSFLYNIGKLNRDGERDRDGQNHEEEASSSSLIIAKNFGENLSQPFGNDVPHYGPALSYYPASYPKFRSFSRPTPYDSVSDSIYNGYSFYRHSIPPNHFE